MKEQPQLIVTSQSGLANRLRVLTSGLALAEATGRSFEMLWPNDRHTCGAGFHELFDSDLPVTDLASEALELRLERESWWVGNGLFELVPDFVRADTDHLRCSYVSWLVDVERGDQHRRILERAHTILGTIEPRDDIAALVEASTSRFVEPTVGVHVRRGDFLSARPEVVGNLDAALDAVREQMALGARSIFLATDDGADPRLNEASKGLGPAHRQGVREAFREAFGEAVIERLPRSLDRSSPIAVADAVADLWTLRQTDVVVGTATSSFSELATVGRPVQRVDVAGAAEPFGRLDRIISRLGLVSVVVAIGRRIYGRDLPLSALTHRATAPIRLITRPVMALARLLRAGEGR